MLEEIRETLIKRQGKPVSGAIDGTVNGTVNDTVNLIKANPKITIDALALKLNKSRRTVTRIIKKLQENGVVFRVGSDKAGSWRVKER
jgi:ATP-dependent DNA helicase RecG